MEFEEDMYYVVFADKMYILKTIAVGCTCLSGEVIYVEEGAEDAVVLPYSAIRHYYKVPKSEVIWWEK